ncbi:MAG: GntR family transcriptional regulator [Clostridiales bacterium]|nr:GntR family transcriptional regulator [Clostridiales bacterium]
MSFNNNQAIYIQIIQYLKTQILSSVLKPGDKLQSVRELADQLKVNPNTVQRAYRELERNELIITLRGQGSYITSDSMILDDLRTSVVGKETEVFIEGMRKLGYDNTKIFEIVKRYLERGE